MVFFVDRYKLPIGMLASVIIGAVSSLLIESTQIITGLGSFHFDDLTANIIGCLIGVVISTLFYCIYRRLKASSQAS